MRVIINGRRSFGSRVLEELSASGDDVVGVICPPADGQRREQSDELALAARDRDIPVMHIGEFSAEAVRDGIARWESDLCVMAYVTAFVPIAILELPRLGTIQFHPSLLPRHRGPSAVNWAIIQGDRRTGITIYWPDDGLDTGAVLLQEEIPIDPDDSAGSLYYEKLLPMGVAALVKSVALVRGGTAPRIEQNRADATYEGWCGQDDVLINWSATTQDLHNLIRGADPSPGAWTQSANGVVRLYQSTALVDPKGSRTAMRRPGTIIAIGDECLQIATLDGAVEIARVRDGDGRKLSAGAYARERGFDIGDQLGE